MSTITFVIPYFGNFPEWSDLYFETVRRNSSINFVFYTDCDFERYASIPNAVFKKITLENYVQYVNNKIDFNFKPANPYKLCDLRPLYPTVHWNDICNSDFYGWTDMDVLFGDIRSFYSEAILSQYDVLSTHKVRVSGHMAIFRNKLKYRNLYKNIYDFKAKLEHPYFVGLDEHGVTNALTMTFIDKFNEKFGTKIDNVFSRLLKYYKTRFLYLEEQYTTPFLSIPWLDGSLNSQQPDTWIYQDGVISNTRDVGRKFIYLHMMNYLSSRYRHDGSTAPWEDKVKRVYATVSDMTSGIQINNDGIYPLSNLL